MKWTNIDTFVLLIGLVAVFFLGFMTCVVLTATREADNPPVRAVWTFNDSMGIIMEVTAYCPCEACCGDWSDRYFADGSEVGGKAIAADTSIYPFGTVFDVPGYGVATVKDRGGAIKGNKLDLYFNSHQEALNWGRKFNVKVRKVK